MSSGGDQTAYDVFVALHVASGIVGFGSVALSGVYGATAKRAGAHQVPGPSYPAPESVDPQSVGPPSVGPRPGGAQPVGPRPGGAQPVDPEALEELRRYFGPPGRLELLIAAVPVFGAAALAVKPGPSEFGQAWVEIGLGLWVVATVLLFGVVRPAEAALRVSVGAGPTGGVGARLQGAGVRLAQAAAVSDLLFLVALILMVIKPGS